MCAAAARIISRSSVIRVAEVVDHDSGALRGEGQGVRPADAVPSAGDDGDTPGCWC